MQQFVSATLEDTYESLNMKITFLGTGTSTGIPQIGCNCNVCQSTDPRDKRLRASVLIELNNKKILIDCGPDFRQQMLVHNPEHIDAILITHGHYDHMGGIDDVRPFGRVQIYAEDIVTEQIKRSMPYCFDNYLYPGVPLITLHEIGTEPFEIDGIKIVPIRVMHANLPILGYRIGKFAYLTDVKSIDDNEIFKLKGLDILVINALRFKSHISHVTIDEATTIAQLIGAKRTYFTHFSHDAGLHASLQKSLPDNIFASFDGMSTEI